MTVIDIRLHVCIMVWGILYNDHGKCSKEGKFDFYT